MRDHLKELWQAKNILWMFVSRDLKARYRNTTLGIAWAIIQPLFLMLIFTLLFDKFFNVSTGGVSYPVFSYAALLPWTFFSRIMSASGTNFSGSRGILTKIYFPREVIPFSVVLSSLIDFGFASIVFIVMLAIANIPIRLTVVFVMLLLPVQIVLGLAISLLFATIGILFFDFKFAIPLLTQLIMYASPIVYSVHNLQTKYIPFFYLNPLTGIIESYRQSIVMGRWPDMSFFLTSVGFAFFAFIVSYWIFKKLEYFFVDVL